MRFLFSFLILCGMILPVQADSSAIYKCKGSNGKMVFQQTPCDEKSITGNSPAHQVWREMRVMVSKGSDNLTSLGASVESIKQCKRNMEVFKSELESIRPKVAKVSRQHPNLAKAFTYLEQCAVCKTSAESFCHSADKSLDEAMVNLAEP